MEDRFEMPDGSVISSLDHPSIVVEKSRKTWSGHRDSVTSDESKASEQTGAPPLVSRGSFPLELRRKRSRKELSLSSLRPFTEGQLRNGLNASRPRLNGLVSGVGKPDSANGLIGDLRDSSNLNKNLHSSSGNVDSWPSENKDLPAQNIRKLEAAIGLDEKVVIPKRPRGTLKRKKPDGFTSSKRVVHDPLYTGKSSADTQNSKFSSDIVLPSQLLDGRQKKRPKKLTTCDFSEDSLIPLKEDKKGSSVQVSSRKVQTRKIRGSSGENLKHLGDEKDFDNADVKFCEDHQDDDEEEEENLEQNAARMLSSRFDPNCTGFSGKRKASSLKSINDSSVSQSLHGKFKGSHSESSPVDAAGMALRPRRRNGKGFVRKRRHFYEVCSRNVDPYSVLKQRIRVFWPLDGRWYFGLVKEYNPATNMHHIKYDDREEEWINLQNERFKLLLFPSEVPSITNSKKVRLESEQRVKDRDVNAIDLNYADSLIESEPIITWLAKSVRPVKASSGSILKSPRRKGHVNPSPSVFTSSKLSSSRIVLNRLVSENGSGVPALKNKTGSDHKRLSFVYSRRRFHNRRESLDNTLEHDSASRTLTAPTSIPASVADDWTAALEDLKSFVSLVKSKYVPPKLMVPLECIQNLPSGATNSWLCRALFLLHYGRLLHLWPMVHMEAVLVDNVMGVRFVSFDGCLRQAVALVCLITTAFCQHNEGSKFVKQKMPSTSIAFKLSSLHDQRGHIFVLFSFLELENSKWRYLEEKLKQHFLKFRELPVADCTSANIKNLPSGCNQILHTSVLNECVSFEGCPESLCSDSMNRLIPNESVDTNMMPAVCYFAEKKLWRRSSCPFSFADAPLFTLSLHLKLLMEKNEMLCCSQKASSVSLKECVENCELIGEGCSLAEDFSDQVSEITLENMESSLNHACAIFEWPASAHHKVENDAVSVSSRGNGSRNNVGPRDLGDSETIIKFQRSLCHATSCGGSKKSDTSFHLDSSSPDKSDDGCHSSVNVDVQIQQFDQVEDQSFTESIHPTSTVCEVNDRAVHNPNAIAPRHILLHNQHTLVSPTSRHHPNLLPIDLLPNSFSFSSRKPRTQVSYSLPRENYELGPITRSHHYNGRSYKKIRTDYTKRISSMSRSLPSYLKFLTCDANVLVTVGDRGWRECAAQVVLESNDQKDWRISVKISGDTKYTHRAHQILQPGTTNRYTHYMMWKGGKDWTLEFPDRSQWVRFKEMYEQCYNQNLRAASVKNIPTPGVRLIDDADESIAEVPFVRSSHKYIRQVGTEVDVALDPYNVLYDMDISDEEWVTNLRRVDKKEGNVFVVTDDMFERVMDMFEKLSYAQSCEEFTGDEIKEYMADVGPLDAINAIHEYWREKRRKKGLPLIRQFQPALWERYQQQFNEWELAVRKMHSLSDGSQDKTCFPRKPSMFAFCLRPRGLVVPNKGLKQRSHKKLMFAGHHNAFMREQDGSHYYAKKVDGHAVGEDKAFGFRNYESCDLFRWRQSSSSFTQPIDATRAGTLTMSSDGSEGSCHPMLSRNSFLEYPQGNSWEMFSSPRGSLMAPFPHNYRSKRNDFYSADLYERPSRKLSQQNGYLSHQVDIDEFRMHDASSAAQHASNMAKLKKERAQLLLHKADRALHKATGALMIAEAIKASEDLIGDG